MSGWVNERECATRRFIRGGGPPGYTPTYGPPYGWGSNSVTNANNLAAGCNVHGSPMDCNSAMIATMGLAFAANLPGAHLDMALAEQQYSQYVSAKFAEADQRKKQRTPPRLRPPNPKASQRRKQIKKKKGLNPYKVKDEGEQNVGIDVGAGEGIFRKRFATTDAPVESKSGMLRPCDEEIERVSDEIAWAFGGTFNDFVGPDGKTETNWEFNLPSPTISVQVMTNVMTGKGFSLFTNWNIREHRPSAIPLWGAYHWRGNVAGNWYHFEFRPTGIGSDEVTIPTDAGRPHYEVDDPNTWHRTIEGKREKCQ